MSCWNSDFVGNDTLRPGCLAVGSRHSPKGANLLIQYSLSATHMPKQRIPLLAVRLQWSHNTFSSDGLISGWVASDANAGVDRSATMDSLWIRRSWRPVAVVR